MWGVGTWAALISTVALLGIGGVAAISGASAPSAPRLSVESAGSRPPVVVIASSGGLAPVAPRAAEPAVATAGDRSWFATAVAGLGVAPPSELDAETDDEMAARRLTGTSATPSVRKPVATPAPRGTAPPAIEIGPARATARAVIESAAPTRTPRPVVEPQEFTAVSTPTGGLSRSAVAANRVATTPTRAPVIRRTRVPAWGTPVASAQPTTTVRPLSPAVTRVPFVPPVLRNGDNKWGVGVYRDSNRVLDVIRETQPGVILLMDPGEGWARKVRETAPNAFIVGRRYLREDNQPLDNPRERGEQIADWVADAAVPLRGVVDAWMSYNEVSGHNDFEGYRKYNEFQVAFANRLQGVHGIAAVAANDGSGAVEPEDYPKYFADAIRASQYFGVHSYSPPATDDMTVDADWNALRYRRIHAALERAGIRGKQMVITESGLGDGFRNGVASDEEMAEDFAWFTRELKKDPYVIGHASFGLFNATGAWDRFEMTDSNVPRLVPELMKATPTPTRR